MAVKCLAHGADICAAVAVVAAVADHIHLCLA
jgi:hypothetical protein